MVCTYFIYQMGLILCSTWIMFFWRKSASSLLPWQVLWLNIRLKKSICIDFFCTCYKKGWDEMHPRSRVLTKCLCLQKDRFYSKYEMASFLQLFTFNSYHPGKSKTIFMVLIFTCTTFSYYNTILYHITWSKRSHLTVWMLFISYFEKYANFTDWS